MSRSPGLLLLPGTGAATAAAADTQRESWLTIHGGQHSSGPTSCRLMWEGIFG